MNYIFPSWRLLALRGGAGILFAALTLAWPLLTLMILIALFASYALLTGFASLADAFGARPGQGGRAASALLGAIGIGAGLIALFRPGLTALALVLLMGANALVAGVLDLLLAVHLRRVAAHAWLLVLAGATSIVFGAIVFAVPGAGAFAMIWLVSLYAFVSGTSHLVLALHVRALTKTGASGGGLERRLGPDRRLA
jgi:uncharacterized membrane protein HdeD (DUF308 family)